MSWLLDGRPLRRVLVTRLRYLGDIAMSTVVLAALRRGDPALRLDYLCDAEHAPLLAGHPLLTAVHALAVRRSGRDAAARAAAAAGAQASGPSLGTVGMVRRLRRQRYDAAVDLFFNPRSAWLLRLAGARSRIGGVIRSHRRRLYTHRASAPSRDERPGLHAVAGGGLAEHLGRLAPLRHADGRPFLDWLEGSFAPGELAPAVARPRLDVSAAAALARCSVEPGRFVLLAPAATWPSKEWPVDHWCGLVERLVAEGRRPVVLCPPRGAGRHAALAAAIPPGRGGMLPPLPLAQALSVVGAAGLLVSVDGGIMHAAVAMGVPTVAIFGPTDPALWFPYEVLGPYRVLATRPACHPCDRHECGTFVCLPDLPPQRVLAAVRSLAPDGAP